MLDRTVPPPYVASSAFELIEPEKKILANGVEVFFIRGGSQDVIKVEVLLKAGRWFEKKWGAGYFTGNLLTKGTRYKNSFQIAQMFDLYGAHVEVHAGLDVASVSLYALGKHLQPALQLLREILKEPIFPQKELDQAKSIYVQNLKVNYEKTSFLASKSFRKHLFGDHHPYGKELEEKDVHTLEQQNLFEHFDNCFQDFVVFASGKIDDANTALISEIFSSWTTRPTKEKPRENPPTKPLREFIEKENSVQSSVRMGRRSILRTDPDYFNTVLTAHILGGYFGSRLMKNIREEKGLTYGIYASLHPLRYGSYLVIGTDVNKENTGLVFEEIRHELKVLRDEEITPDELETARNHFIGSLESEITTPFAHAEKLKTIYLYGLSPRYYHDMISSMRRTVPAEIAEVSSRHLNENDFFEIAAG